MGATQRRPRFKWSLSRAWPAPTGRKNEKGPHKGAHSSFGSGGSLQTLSSTGHSAGYSFELTTLEDGQSAAVRALTTFGAGRCIACQRS